MEIYLVRHTRVAVPKGVCYGRTDVPLADSFMEEATAVRHKLPQEIGMVYGSPLSRCVQLAARLVPQPVFDERLQEYDFGEWEMVRWDEISGATAAQWFADFVQTPVPQGESYVQMAERVVGFWEEVVMAQRGQLDRPLVVVTHAGVIRALLAHHLQMPLAQAFNLTVDMGGVTLLTVGEAHIQVEYINR